ncbi:hypothetical protein G6F46_007154 [Rhizopus delemar]|uniref:C2H2-type domain-containing protein n=2 Tax=Rhizopus TaxID=4842 RepID=A0A9P6YYW3_9FUNG|nr:hypothetical protein G6F43_009539 [Rhizopus delemar]KAG1536224.1 hypothetical protein G6F51_011085 [Rhizopus arrhizus]KAG1448929.1 hypothetical protein G6F55_010410 [Rhizopus delemar]KAG1489518.1 hypothetical protein G6F54_011378 [Rhizopus delemar]KAG1518853.1 hypothetical protein G6F53_000261 [Rhizopus delemar]
MQSNEKPKLPSIQSMLEGISLDEAANRSRGHRRHASEHSSAFKPFVDQKGMNETSVSGQLEKLSIQPIPIEPKIDEPPNNQALLFHHLPFRPHLSSYRHNLHSRSYSDHTHPYPTTTTPSTVTRHRRTVSTNTFDLLLQPHHRPAIDPPLPLLCTSSSSSSTVTTNAPTSPHTSEEEEDEKEDETDSEGSVYSDTAQKPSQVSKKPMPQSRKRRPPPSKRYYCSYCSKAFSRPSSLRIHTYSHTGERPFECPEKGCNRKFSVQSNMRRHLRVHGTSRSSKRNPTALTPSEKAQWINKPLAAKPIIWNNSNLTLSTPDHPH